MGVTIATTRVACNTGTGNQDITTADLGGLTPKSAWFTITRAASDGVAADHAAFGVGAATATDERWAMCVTAEHGQATTDTHRQACSDQCVLILNPTDGSVDGEADFVSFITNGVRINWGNAPAAAYLLTVRLYAGTDYSGKADVLTQPDAVDATLDVNTVGFESDVVEFATHNKPFDDTSYASGSLSLGFAINKTPVVMAAIYLTLADGRTEGQNAGQITNTYAYGQFWSGASEVLEWTSEISDFDAQGFTVTNRLDTSSSDQIGYLAHSFGGVANFDGDIATTPTSTGNASVTAPGFTPQHVAMCLTQAAALDTTYTDGGMGSFGLSAFDADDEYCDSIQDEDNQATTDTQSLSDNTAVNLPLHTGAAALVASFVSFDANGWTLNWTDAEATGKKYWWWAVQETPAALPIISGDAIHSLVFGGVTVR